MDKRNCSTCKHGRCVSIDVTPFLFGCEEFDDDAEEECVQGGKFTRWEKEE